MMASFDGNFETENGIEASDLASLLCRFEEVTSSVSDWTFCAQNKRDNLIKLRISRTMPDSALTSDRSAFGSTVTNERKVDEPLQSTAHNDTSADTGLTVPLSVYHTEPTVTTTTLYLNAESPLLTPIDQPETTLAFGSQLMIESLGSLSKEVFEQHATSSISGPYQPDSSTNSSLLKESVLQDVLSKSNNLTSEYLQNLEPTISLDVSTRNSFVSLPSHKMYSQCPLLSTTDTIADVIPVSSHVIQSMDSHTSPVLSSNIPISENITEMLDSICMESSSYTENCKLSSQTAMYDHQNIAMFYGLDHSYCSNNLPSVSEMHISRCPDKYLRDSSFTSFRNIQQLEKTLDDGKMCQGVTVLCNHWSMPKSNNADESIVEESEILIDSDGNDLYSHDVCQQSDTVKTAYIYYNHEAIARTIEKKENRKRLHSCLQHMEFIAGPNCEDRSLFFDKIPSYYTALSIPSKPVTTTVFASTTKAIGTTDHLDFLDASGPFDEGHYDKVPAHRRCFTNTTKEVEINLERSEIQNSVSSSLSMQASFQNYSQHEMDNLSISLQSCFENPATAADVKPASMSYSTYSETQGRRSRSKTRRSGSVSRFSKRSTSSMSDCSTCSSCSNSCSTCSVLSRSPSSSGSERGSSRSRSPDASNGSIYSAKRSRSEFTPSKVRQSRSRTLSPSEESICRSKRHSYRSRHTSSMEVRMSEKQKIKEQEQVKAMEERRIVYVGKIPDGYTKRQLYQRFQSFGEIKEVKVNFREHGDNYGFVTFAYACDAITAKEKGNIISGEVKFDLCFGGRRHFCPDQYSDLDGNREIEEEYAPMSRNLTQELDYASLLKLHSTNQKKKI